MFVYVQLNLQIIGNFELFCFLVVVSNGELKLCWRSLLKSLRA